MDQPTRELDRRTPRGPNDARLYPSRARFDVLVGLVLHRGERFAKDHGSWVRLRLTPDVSLTLDSYSSALTLVAGGAPYDNPVTGFAGKRLEYVGTTFGGYAPRISAARLESLIRAVEALPEAA